MELVASWDDEVQDLVGEHVVAFLWNAQHVLQSCSLGFGVMKSLPQGKDCLLSTLA